MVVLAFIRPPPRGSLGVCAIIANGNLIFGL